MEAAEIMEPQSTLYEFSATTIDGETVRLDRYRGQVLLIVNVASQCGFTPQYAELEALYRNLKPKGFSILGFPCNQFAKQEPGSESEIKEFCSRTYDVTFPLFAKINVNGDGAHPLYVWLKSQARGVLGTEAIKWNFTKFLVDAQGKVVDRYAPNATPSSIEPDIVRILGAPDTK